MIRKGLKILLLLLWVQCSYAQRDTTLVSIPADTAWKSDPAFSYMSDIDSLLHVMNNRKSKAKVVVFHPTTSEDDDQGILKVFQNPVVRAIFWIAIAIFLGYIIYMLFFKFGILDKSKDTSESADIFEEKDLDTFENYRKAVNEAEAKGNYKLSVRYLFLSLLSTLQQKQMIEFIPEKTNDNYICEVSSRDIESDFRHLTMVYEYYWYGNNPLEKNNYSVIRSQFENLFNNI